MDEEFKLTNPEPVGGREDHDHYPSPKWTVRLLLDHLQVRPPGVVLDPCAGEGSILDVARERGLLTVGLELDKGRAGAARHRGHPVEVCNALEAAWPAADLIVTNPPYSLGESFIRRALAWQREWPFTTRVYALLRLSWLEPAGTRAALLRAHPADVKVLPRRPNFDGRGNDSITSAWFCWPGSHSKTVVECPWSE